MSASLVWNTLPVRAAGTRPCPAAISRPRLAAIPQRRSVARAQPQPARRRSACARCASRPAWRPLLAMAGDVLAVSVWAALIPGVMWLGSAAGF